MPPAASLAESRVDAAVFLSPQTFACTNSPSSRQIKKQEDFCLQNSLPSALPDKSILDKVSPECLNIVSINLRSILAHRAELEARLAELKPHIVCIQETWLDDGVENPEVDGYKIVSRRDRTETAKDGYGGVLVLARDDVENIAELKKSKEDERTWCTIHTSIGPVLLGNWYREPRDDATSSMPRCRSELQELMEDHIGTVLVGDINVHYRRWLRYSNGNTMQGKLMYDICTDFGLIQGVHEPTRGDYLLDLVMSDMLSMASVKVLAPIADHCVVSTTLDVETASADPVERFVWDYCKADWTGLRAALAAVDWKSMFADNPVDEGAEQLTRTIMDTAKQHIPHRMARFNKRSHPWLTNRALAAIREKCDAYGTEAFESTVQKCREIIADEYKSHTRRLRSRISSLKRGSKRWWVLNRQLLHKTSKTTSIPPLRGKDSNWIMDPPEKAQLLADTFADKCTLPPASEHDVPVAEPAAQLSGFLPIRARTAKKILKAIDPDKATGPDGLPGRILRQCASELAAPLAIFARRMVADGAWPELWREHWIHPLYKKGATSNSKNYRGVHLTPVLSKILERIISVVFVPFLDKAGIYGRSQWAFRPRHSCRDLVTLKVAQWIQAVGRGHRVGLYLSDISGAFDRVDSEILLKKCHGAGLGDRVCKFLRAFLAPRRAVVLVQGAKSRETIISNQVYQGTVLGPPLWNLYFADVSTVATKNGFRETKFADDLSCDKVFAKNVTDEEVFQNLRGCQTEVHGWGELNRVQFDPLKEEMKIIHGKRPHGEPFKFLGPMIDTKLVMDSEVRRIRQKTKPKVKAILRTRPYYSLPGLVNQFKAHVLPILEGTTGAIYHASTTQLRKVDAVQASFLHGLQLSVEEAFLQHNLAPLQLRRDIGILGLLFKIARGEAHPDFEELFPRDLRARNWTTRANKEGHNMRLCDTCDGGQSDLINRSIFSAVRVFNRLPAFTVDVSSVRAFQRLLTERARHACRSEMPKWESMYSSRGVFR